MIQAQNIHKKFGRFQALNDVSLHAEGGQCIALIGPNGCGKTTFLKCLLGMVVPDKGVISVNGQNIRNNWAYKSQIGYMPQIGSYPANMRMGQVLDMLSDIRNSDKKPDEEIIASFELEKLYHKRTGTLSGGTRQKLSAALAFLFDPEILILDEPTAGLDPLSSEILKEKIIAEKQKGKLVLITSHILSELDDLVSHVVYMQEGRIRYFKELTRLKEETGEEKLSRAIAHFMKRA